MENTPHTSGFVSLVGKPNAGKSTLLNALLGQKLSIVTHKAQTTRHRILGILNEPHYQLVFQDTPGVIAPRYKLQEKMMGAVESAMSDAEVIVLVVNPGDKPTDSGDAELVERLRKYQAPVVLAVNKSDLSDPDRIVATRDLWREAVPTVKAAVPVSALHKFNTEALIQEIVALLPEGPPYFDKDQVTDRPERFFVAEIIREKIFLNYSEEIPYSTEVTILLFEERENVTYIDAEIHVERQSQKGILIGKGAVALKKIGTQARRDIEVFLDRRVFLNLYVRVAENWKNTEGRLRQFGYE